MKRAVLTTSSASLHHMGIATDSIGNIPLHIRFGDQWFLDNGEKLSPKILSKMMADNPKVVVNTRPASPDEVHEIFSDLYRRNYDEVFVCCLSSRFSESYKILEEQKNLYTGRMNIYIYDTKTVNIAEAALAYEASYMIQGGATFGEVVARLDQLRAKSVLTLSLYDLNYIIRNKKLSAPAGFIANLFDVKPVMQITSEGLLVPTSKVRKFERALREMIKIVDETTRGQDRYLYMTDASFGDLTERCAQIVMQEMKIESLPIIPASCVSMGNHGPDGVALGAFYGQLPKIISQLPVYKEG
ncbi:MAG: DegV family protein [Moraxella sp.]|nr:DegV family protein [Moraxella sp.]